MGRSSTAPRGSITTAPSLRKAVLRATNGWSWNEVWRPSQGVSVCGSRASTAARLPTRTPGGSGPSPPAPVESSGANCPSTNTRVAAASKLHRSTAPGPRRGAPPSIMRTGARWKAARASGARLV